MTKTSLGIHSPFFDMRQTPVDEYCHGCGEMMNEVDNTKIICGQQSKNRKTMMRMMMTMMVREVEAWAFGVREWCMFEPGSIRIFYQIRIERWAAKGLTAAVQAENASLLPKSTSVRPGQRHEGLGQIYFWETGIKFEVGRGVKRQTKLFLGTGRIDSMPKRLHTKKKKTKKTKKRVIQEWRWNWATVKGPNKISKVITAAEEE